MVSINLAFIFIDFKLSELSFDISYLLRKKSLAKKNESKTEEVDHVEDEVEEEPGLREQDDSPGVVDDDGAMADLQCMLANALMESGPFTPLTVEEDDDEAEEGKA